MGEKKRDALGDRMKMFEDMEGKRRFIPGLPLVARIDGRSFSNFTHGLERPYDQRFSKLMVEITKFLVDETGAKIGYTQSDEISLLFYSDDLQSEIFFNGRVQKMVSILAGLASARFNKIREDFLPNHKPHATPVFDARVWTFPNQIQATSCFVWREQDATKNSISMLAQHYFSHKQLMYKNTKEMIRMLEVEHNVFWDTYPNFFKRGTYVQRKSHFVSLPEEALQSLPPGHEARHNPNFKVERHSIVALDLPILTRIQNRIGVIFHGEEPVEMQMQDDFIDDIEGSRI